MILRQSVAAAFKGTCPKPIGSGGVQEYLSEANR